MRRTASMLRRGGSQFRAPADRRVTIAVRFPVYRQVGRRPSQVYIDDSMNPAASGSPERRLSDRVFWRAYAEVGDQIEERSGDLLLLAGALACHPIQLSEPRPLEVMTAFGHADAVLRDNRKILDGLLAEGSVFEAPARRSKASSLQLSDTVFADDHPLVITTRPPDIEEAETAVPAVCEGDAGSDLRLPVRG